jgi:hypothetical protein
MAMVNMSSRLLKLYREDFKRPEQVNREVAPRLRSLAAERLRYRESQLAEARRKAVKSSLV